jgi:hypothetical protein
MKSFDYGVLGLNWSLPEISDAIADSCRAFASHIQSRLQSLVPETTVPLLAKRASHVLEILVKCQSDQDFRQKKQVEKLWARSHVDDPSQDHWKLAPVLDSQGRRYLLERNFKFSDHAEASRKRDLNRENQPILFNLPLPFGSDFVIDHREIDFFETEAHLIIISILYAGIFQLSDKKIMFEAHHGLNLGTGCSVSTSKFCEIELSDVVLVLRRRHLHRDDSYEIFTQRGRSYFFTFPKGARDALGRVLSAEGPYVQTGSPADVLKDLQIVELWQSGELSNYEYLYWMNIIGGRSFNDVSQYPIYPWVLTSYQADDLDLQNSGTFRDLALPIGLINTDRFEVVKQLYNEGTGPDRSHFSTLYSSPTIVADFLVRLEPFTSCHIFFQNGQFEKADRLFSSIPMAWHDVQLTIPDFRELTPEFFSLSSFLVNSNGFDLGPRSDVVLPKWSKSAPEFIYFHRAALESVFVSRHLNSWVDLVFGFKSRGPAAIQFSNDFPKLCYPDCLADDQELTVEIADGAFNVGVVPELVFAEPSPKRTSEPVPGFAESPSLSPLRDVKDILKGIALSANRVLLIGPEHETVIYSTRDRRSQNLRCHERFAPYFAPGCFHAFLASENLIVVGWTVRRNIHVMHIEENEVSFRFSGAAHFGSVRKVLIDSAPVLAAKSVRIYIGCLCSENNLIIWMTDRGFAEVKRIHSGGESTRLIDMDISASLDIAVTITGEPRLVLRNLTTLQIYRSVDLERVPSGVRVTRSGLVAVVSQGGDTRVDVYDLECTCLFTKSYIHELHLFEIRPIDWVDDLLVICFSDGELVSLKLFGLVQVSQTSLEQLPVALSVGDARVVFLTFANGTIATINIRQ